MFTSTITMNVGGYERPSTPATPSPPLSPPQVSRSQSPEQRSLWRFWKWIPPMGARPVCGTDDYGQLMAGFKEHLSASQSCLYAINELRLFATLEVPSILDYVNEDAPMEGGAGGSDLGHPSSFSSSISSSSLASSYSSSHSLSPSSSHSGGPSSSSSSQHSVRGYYIFKDGIWPLWEDEYNAAGGCWTFRHTVNNRKGGGAGHPREMWKRLILTLSDPRMSPFLEAGEICGAGLTVRETARGGWTYKFSIWNSNAENTISKLMIGATLKSLVSLPSGNGNGPVSHRLFYYSHRTNMTMQQLHQPIPPIFSGFSSNNGNGLKRKTAPRNFNNYGSRGGGAPRKKSVTFVEQ